MGTTFHDTECGTVSQTVQSVDRALRLAKLLYEREQLRVHEAAEALDLPDSTAHRLLGVLVEHEFAVRNRHHVYGIGPFLRGLRDGGPTVAARAALVQLAHPELVELARLTRETVHLVVLEGNGVRFIDGVDGVQTIRVAPRIGLVLPAHLTSGGKALLAELAPTELAALYPRGLALRPDAAGPDLTTLRRELQNVRRRGYAINAEESEQGVLALGTSVRDSAGTAIAAVVLAAPSQRISRRTLAGFADPVFTTAHRISDRLR